MISLFLSIINLANSATFTWDKNSEPNIAGYRLHYGDAGEASGTYSKTLEIGNTNLATLETLSPGTYRAAITAYNTENLESEYSNEVSFTISNDAPSITSQFTLTPVSEIGTTGNDYIIRFREQPGQKISLQFSEDLLNWNIINESVINDTGIYVYRISVDGSLENLSSEQLGKFYRVVTIP